MGHRLAYYGEYDYLRDRFAGISSRNDVVGGISYLFVDTPLQQFMGNIGLGYSNEQRLAGDDLSTAIWTTGESYRLKLSSTAEFTDDFVFNEALSDAGDWRISHVAAVTAKLTSLFSLRVSTRCATCTSRWTGSSRPTASRRSRWSRDSRALS